MAHRSIGQEQLGFVIGVRSASSLDELDVLIDWKAVAELLGPLYPATKGEPAWPPLAMFKALLLSVWYDLSDVKLVETVTAQLKARAVTVKTGTMVDATVIASASEKDDDGRWVKHSKRFAGPLVRVMS